MTNALIPATGTKVYAADGSFVVEFETAEVEVGTDFLTERGMVFGDAGGEDEHVRAVQREPAPSPMRE